MWTLVVLNSQTFHNCHNVWSTISYLCKGGDRHVFFFYLMSALVSLLTKNVASSVRLVEITAIFF